MEKNGIIVSNKHVNGLEINLECVIITFHHGFSGFNVVAALGSIQLFHAFMGNSQNYRSRGRRPTVHHVVHSTEGAMVLTVAHEGMK